MAQGQSNSPGGMDVIAEQPNNERVNEQNEDGTETAETGAEEGAASGVDGGAKPEQAIEKEKDTSERTNTENEEFFDKLFRLLSRSEEKEDD